MDGKEEEEISKAVEDDAGLLVSEEKKSGKERDL